MTDFPGGVVTPLFIHTYSGYSAVGTRCGAFTIASATWPVANTAYYIPFWLPFPYNVRRVFWVNGSSVTSTNRDFGIYTADGVRLYSTTSTAAVGISVPQYVDATDFLLTPGAYYFGLSSSSITANRGTEWNRRHQPGNHAPVRCSPGGVCASPAGRDDGRHPHQHFLPVLRDHLHGIRIRLMAAPSTRNIIPLLQFGVTPPSDPVKTKLTVVLQAVSKAANWVIS